MRRQLSHHLHHQPSRISEFTVALFFIAIYALSTGASAQKVYRCGNTYSQAPCPGGDAVDTSGSQVRAQAQKAQSEAARSAKAADKMEKTRLSQEKRDLAKNGATVITAQPLPKDAAREPEPKAAAKPKRHPPEHFTAKAPAEPKAKAKASSTKE